MIDEKLQKKSTSVLGYEFKKIAGTSMYAEAVMRVFLNFVCIVLFLSLVIIGYLSWLSLNLYKDLKLQPVLVMSKDGRYTEFAQQMSFGVSENILKEFVREKTPLIFTPNMMIDKEAYLERMKPFCSAFVLMFVSKTYDEIVAQNKRTRVVFYSDFDLDTFVFKATGNPYRVEGFIETFTSDGINQFTERKQVEMEISYVGCSEENHLGLMVTDLYFIKEDVEGDENA